MDSIRSKGIETRTVEVDLEGASGDQTLRDGAHEQDHSEAPDAVVQRLLQQRDVQAKLAEDLSPSAVPREYSAP